MTCPSDGSAASATVQLHTSCCGRDRAWVTGRTGAGSVRRPPWGLEAAGSRFAFLDCLLPLAVSTLRSPAARLPRNREGCANGLPSVHPLPALRNVAGRFLRLHHLLRRLLHARLFVDSPSNRTHDTAPSRRSREPHPGTHGQRATHVTNRPRGSRACAATTNTGGA